ncbi:hypothetical protein ACJROX_06825 [Pseudalkalibacillus sp. A8]|uniref:hypothetical protein n=1 Tax=Pseudalkalibacillus sp. A8 TaxID=3382641 RepID=UPI0038B5EB53
MLIITFIIVWLLPKRLPRKITYLSLLWGLSSGMLLDFTIGGGQMDFYKVNDVQNYELFDFLYYVLFSPFGYFFVYFYEHSISINILYLVCNRVELRCGRSKLASYIAGYHSIPERLYTSLLICGIFDYPDNYGPLL